VCTIGRDIYNDTRIILTKLEQLFPASEYPSLSPVTIDQKAMSKLLETWAVDAGIFVRSAQLIPADTPLRNDPVFQKDRADFSGNSWSEDAAERNRPEALVEIRGAFEFLEMTMFTDGRDWILKTEGPSLADIEGAS